MTFLNFTFQDPSPIINYSTSQWVEGTANDSFAGDYSDSDFTLTSIAGSTASLSFVGTSITIFGAKRPNHGNYSVVLDKEPEFVGDGNGNNIFKFPLWNAQNLSNSNHFVTVTNIPTGQGKFWDVDFVSIGRELGPPGFDGQIFNVTLDDESPFVVYNGSWLATSDPTAFNSSLHSTTEAGSSMSLFFQGSSIELYGLYENGQFQINLDNQLAQQFGGSNVGLNTQQRHSGTLLYLMDGLDENKTHVITMTNTASDSEQTLFFDSAIIRSSQNFFNGTPSPNPDFAIPSSSATSSSSANATANSKSVPVGAIIGGVIGGVGGLIIIAFIAFILLRRSRFYSPPRRSIEEEGNVPRRESMTHQAITPTPFILPPPAPSLSSNSTNPRTVDPFSKSVKRVIITSGSGSMSLSDSTGAPISPQTSSPHGSEMPFQFGSSAGQPPPPLVAQTYILQEHDAGRLIQTRLPPMYNEDWQGTSQPPDNNSRLPDPVGVIPGDKRAQG